MLVEWTAAAAAAFYAANIPLKLAVRLCSDAQGVNVTAGFGAFENRFAMNAARKNVPLKKPKNKKPFRERVRSLSDLRSVFGAGKYLLRHLRLEYFCLQGALGLSDAMSTAMTCGALAAAGQAASAVSNGRIRIRLEPDFSGRHFSGEICGIVSARAGHIMFAAIYGAIEYGNGRLAQWIHTRSKTS